MSDQHIVLERDSVHILRTVFLWRGTAYQRLRLRNYGERVVDLRLLFRFENEFADLFEVRGAHRARRGTATAKLHGNDEVVLSYRGLDAKLRRTALTFDPPPAHLTVDSAVYDIRLNPGEKLPIFIAVSCDPTRPRPLPFLRGLIAARRQSLLLHCGRRWRASASRMRVRRASAIAASQAARPSPSPLRGAPPSPAVQERGYTPPASAR